MIPNFCRQDFTVGPEQKCKIKGFAALPWKFIDNIVKVPSHHLRIAELVSEHRFLPAPATNLNHQTVNMVEDGKGLRFIVLVQFKFT